MLNFKTYICRMEALDPLDPEYPLIFEGAQEAELLELSDSLHRTAAELGIQVIGPELTHCPQILWPPRMKQEPSVRTRASSSAVD